ncbi:MAG: hypothetical protein ABDH21_04890 [bacterium]
MNEKENKETSVIIKEHAQQQTMDIYRKIYERFDKIIILCHCKEFSNFENNGYQG